MLRVGLRDAPPHAAYRVALRAGQHADGVCEGDLAPPPATAPTTARSSPELLRFSQLTHWTPELLIAWLFNGALLWGSCAALLGVTKALSLLQTLDSFQAPATDFALWKEQVVRAFALSCFFSFVVVDALKVVCLSLTSGPALAALGLIKASAAGKEKHLLGRGPLEGLRKLLRRLHRLLDFLT